MVFGSFHAQAHGPDFFGKDHTHWRTKKMKKKEEIRLNKRLSKKKKNTHKKGKKIKELANK